MPDKESRCAAVVGSQVGADTVSAGKAQNGRRQRLATSKGGRAINAPRSRLAAVALRVIRVKESFEIRLAVRIRKQNAPDMDRARSIISSPAQTNARVLSLLLLDGALSRYARARLRPLCKTVVFILLRDITACLVQQFHCSRRRLGQSMCASTSL
jgi:hypothetical protein